MKFVRNCYDIDIDIQDPACRLFAKDNDFHGFVINDKVYLSIRGYVSLYAEFLNDEKQELTDEYLCSWGESTSVNMVALLEMKIEYSNLLQSDLSSFGCSFPLLSDYSMKVSVDDEIVGFVAIEDRPLVLQINRRDSQEVRSYKEGINNSDTFYLRKIMFSSKYEDSLLLPLFLKVNKRIPYYNYSIWCKPQIWDVNHYIDKIGGFMSPSFNVGRNIVLFSLNI